MYEIEFTQYFLLNGRKETVHFENDDKALFDKSMNIRDAGFHFECEVLRTGQVSFTIGDEDGDYVYQIAVNGPDVPKAVEMLINKHSIAEIERIRDEVNNPHEDEFEEENPDD